MKLSYNEKEFQEYCNDLSEHKILTSRIISEWQRRKIKLLNIIPYKIREDNNAITIDNIDRALFLSKKISHIAKHPDFLEWLKKTDNKLIQIKAELKKLSKK